MPVTPFHLGPGSIIKSLFREKFSLTLFGFSQGVIDIQPVIAITTGIGEAHGITHSYLGATIVAIVAAIIGKPLCEYLLRWWNKKLSKTSPAILFFPENISWPIAISSAFLGTYSHVLLDSFMHYDMQPFYPAAIKNNLLEIVTITELHLLCSAAAVLGFVLYFGCGYWLMKNKGKTETSLRNDSTRIG